MTFNDFCIYADITSFEEQCKHRIAFEFMYAYQVLFTSYGTHKVY